MTFSAKTYGKAKGKSLSEIHSKIHKAAPVAKTTSAPPKMTLDYIEECAANPQKTFDLATRSLEVVDVLREQPLNTKANYEQVARILASDNVIMRLTANAHADRNAEELVALIARQRPADREKSLLAAYAAYSLIANGNQQKEVLGLVETISAKGQREIQQNATIQTLLRLRAAAAKKGTGPAPTYLGE